MDRIAVILFSFARGSVIPEMKNEVGNSAQRPTVKIAARLIEDQRAKQRSIRPLQERF